MHTPQHKLTDGRFKILSCDTRRNIISLIKDNPKTVREIAQHLNVAIYTVQRHIKPMLSCNIVTIRKKGNIPLYQSNSDTLTEIIELLKTFY